ncbi:hypothetical protein PTTG_04321 [Puccinia triticina 1-1 BBBD Race 1]|uniref:Uncharacterized protein n=1 Tax=Puccinia triticina (isolate 1-1 / race 1 (BBBD)) TaxID=630390 RepID=A0A180GNP6_PUCT1|nr:hypothetical protein PTTG_04321 [Puccinia triticina 1-1 BBBD Race 1]
MALILNEAQAEEPTIFEPSAAAALPLIIPEPAGRKHHHILPLNEHPSTLPLAPQPPSPNRHPTFLLNNFPHRPHYYQPDSVGAQPGYCLSPVPPSLRHLTNAASPAHRRSACPSGPKTTLTSPAHCPASSAALSSLPSLSTTIASSASSSSSSSPFEIALLSEHKPAAEDTPSRSQKAAPASMIITKKILPIPPSLSPRVRQIFLNKINSQQAQSCAQLPRRKKKKAVEPLSLPPV